LDPNALKDVRSTAGDVKEVQPSTQKK